MSFFILPVETESVVVTRTAVTKYAEDKCVDYPIISVFRQGLSEQTAKL